MWILRILRHLASLINESVIVKRLRLWLYERDFASSDGFAKTRGVYGSFDEANRSAPSGAKTGFDFTHFVDEFALRAQRIYPYDYPVLFWLLPILPAAKKVFDIGGHIGVHYYGYQRYLPFPPALKWEVCEVPSIAKTGAELARQKGAHNLVFTSDFARAEGADILLAAGSLQYIESPRIEVLCRNGNFPFQRSRAFLRPGIGPLFPACR